MNTVDVVRARFEALNKEYLAYSDNKKFAEPSKLRIEQPLTSGNGRYEFNIKKQDIANAFEKSLDRNDVFVPNFIGLFIALRPTTNPSTEVLSSFPLYNDGSNPSPYAAGFTAKDPEAIYNGTLQWTIDNGVMLSAFPTEVFRKVPNRQGKWTVTTLPAGTALDTKNQVILPEWDIKEASEFIVPKLTIAGTRDHKLTVNFNASGLTFSCTTNYTPYLVLYMDGFLIKGGCEILDGKNPNYQAVGQW